ncbi:PD-(D/E)XK nuclease family protein [Sulfurivermis fontis]|uniref:PD-(D/E)XK nuclease family protein n=1 Tax=Sulfurivermis fontis TaxID=1972068 RepID=UPI000FDC485A|nr:PD-(D/E)XK nuclease family protein [Sulfurivermis fontis]
MDALPPLSTAADPLAALADRILAEQAGQLPLLAGVTVLLPAQETAPRLRRLLLAGAAARGHRALLGPRLLTLGDWLAGFAPGHSVISDYGRELLLVEALRDQRQMFGHGNLWSLADSLLDLFDELTLNRIGLPPTLEEFRRRLVAGYGPDSHALGALALEARVVHTLWQAWHQQMEARGVIDRPAATLLRLAASLEHIDGPLYLAGFRPANRAEAEWLAALRQHPAVRAVEQQTEPAKTDSPYAAFLNQALWPQAHPLAERAHAFAAAHPVSPAAGRLVIHAADGAEQEARAVELQVRLRLLDGCDSVAVITENRRLARRVRALLERAEVAVQDAAGWALSTTSAAAALERWLQCVEEDFPYQAMLDLLKSPFVFTGAERATRLNDVYRLEQGVVLQGNIGRSLARYRQQLRERQLLLPAEMAPELERIAALLDHLEYAATPLRLLSAYPQRPDRLLAALDESLRRLGLAASFAADAAGARLLQELAAMAAAVEQDTPPLAWSEFRAWLSRTLERYNFRPPVSGSRVQLMGLEQSRLGHWDAIIIAGAEREYLPGAPTPSPFFNEAVRRELGLPTAEERCHERLLQFRRLLEAAPHVTLTLRRQQDGEDVLPSPWVEALRAFHHLAWNAALSDPQLAAWTGDAQTEVFLCDTPALPTPPGLARPTLPAALLPKTLSASGYQQLIDCPYRFFAARALGLAPPEAIREALEKADYGERVHRALQAFHHGLPGLPGPFGRVITAANRDEAEALLRDIAEQVFADDVAGNLLHRGWLLRWQAVIPRYIKWELEREQQGWRVHQAELTLRREDWLPGLTLKGRIDRLDRGPDGHGIVDYKTGTVPKDAEVHEGEAVQLPFYALLSDEAIAQAEYVALDGENVSARATLSAAELTALRDANAQRLRTLYEEIAAGRPLPAWGDSRTCRRCDMAGVCRRAACDEEVTAQ